MLERFDDTTWARRKFEQVVIKPVRHAANSVDAACLRGEVDMVTDVPPDAVEFVQNDDIEVVSFPRRYQFLVAFNSQSRRSRRRRATRAELRHRSRRLIAECASGPRRSRRLVRSGRRHWAYDASVATIRVRSSRRRVAAGSGGLQAHSVRTASQPPAARLRFTCLFRPTSACSNGSGWKFRSSCTTSASTCSSRSSRSRSTTLRIRDGQFRRGADRHDQRADAWRGRTFSGGPRDSSRV